MGWGRRVALHVSFSKNFLDELFGQTDRAFPLAYTLSPLKRLADMMMTTQNKDSDVRRRQVMSLYPEYEAPSRYSTGEVWS
jgi:hypothetical protein